MHPAFRQFLGILVFLAISATAADAQVVERPIAFDSAGRVLVLTPETAARARLAPPAWRVTGAFDNARLFALGDGSFVLVVTRPSGSVERYPLTQADIADLQWRVASLPAARIPETERNVRNAFKIGRAHV